MINLLYFGAELLVTDLLSSKMHISWTNKATDSRSGSSGSSFQGLSRSHVFVLYCIFYTANSTFKVSPIFYLHRSVVTILVILDRIICTCCLLKMNEDQPDFDQKCLNVQLVNIQLILLQFSNMKSIVENIISNIYFSIYEILFM